MNHNVSQSRDGSRLESVFHVRIETATLSLFREIAERDGRTPSGLARKVVTDFVRRSQAEAAPKPQVQPQKQTRFRSPWEM